MHVAVDATRCDGYGRCAELAPSLFALDEWGYGAPTADGLVPPGDEDLARHTASECPVKAILIREGGDGARAPR
jgi:ferredoxin